MTLFFFFVFFLKYSLICFSPLSKTKFLIVNHLPLVYLSTGAILSSCPVSQVCLRISFPQVKGCFEAFAVKKIITKKQNTLLHMGRMKARCIQLCQTALSGFRYGIGYH